MRMAKREKRSMSGLRREALAEHRARRRTPQEHMRQNGDPG